MPAIPIGILDGGLSGDGIASRVVSAARTLNVGDEIRQSERLRLQARARRLRRCRRHVTSGPLVPTGRLRMPTTCSNRE